VEASDVMRRAIPAVVLGILASGCRSNSAAADAGSARDPSDARREIVDLMRAQEVAWNQGDIAAFMELGYWRSPDLTFYSGGEVSRGFEEMLARYRKNYEGPGKERGTLAFTQLDVVPLAGGVALARGRWDLDYVAKKDVGGLFTLALRHTDAGWRIVHDHTSVDG